MPSPAARLRDIAALTGLLLAALALRWSVASAALADLTGSEAAAGLVVQRILAGDRPLFLDAAATHGSLEAYLAAPLFIVAGGSQDVLRLIPLIGSLTFVAATYVLARTIWDGRVARWSAFFAAVGPALLVVTGLRAGSGAIEMLSLGTWALAWLALSLNARSARVLSFAGIGCLLGLAVWSHPAGLVFVLSIIPPVMVRWFGRGSQPAPASQPVKPSLKPSPWGHLAEAVFLLAGLAIGVAPLVWSALIQPGFMPRWLLGQSDPSLPRLLDGVASLVTVSLPVAAGLLQPIATPAAAAELLAEARVWQLGGICLMAAVYVSIFGYLVGGTARRTRPGWWLSLPLLFAPLLYLLRLSNPATEPVDLLPIYSSLPLIVAVAVQSSGYQRRSRRFLLFGSLAILLLSFTLTFEPGATRPVANAASPPGSPREVVGFLDEHAIDAFYADGAIALVVTFETGGRIAGAAVQGAETLAWNPAPDVVVRVSGASSPAYVFARNSTADRAFTARLLREQISAQRGETEHFAIYYAPSRLPAFP